MSASTKPQDVSQFEMETTPGQGGLGEATSAYWDRIKGGDLGSLPAVLGCVVLITHNMNDVFQVADSIACLFLGQMAAQVRAKDVNNTQVIELITAGRSGDIGLRPAEAAAMGTV